jgi:hypothetical protein
VPLPRPHPVRLSVAHPVSLIDVLIYVCPADCTLSTWASIQAKIARRAPHLTVYTVQPEGLLAVSDKSRHSTSLRVLCLRRKIIMLYSCRGSSHIGQIHDRASNILPTLSIQE